VLQDLAMGYGAVVVRDTEGTRARREVEVRRDAADGLDAGAASCRCPFWRRYRCA